MLGGVCVLKLLFATSLCTFMFGMLTATGNTLVVTLHAVDALAGLCKDELLDLCVAGAASKASGMVGLVAGHDGFLHDGKTADVAGVVALAADGVAIGEEKNVIAICAHSIVALCTTEALDMPEFGCKLDDALFDAVFVDETATAAAVGFGQLVFDFVHVCLIGS